MSALERTTDLGQTQQRKVCVKYVIIRSPGPAIAEVQLVEMWCPPKGRTRRMALQVVLLLLVPYALPLLMPSWRWLLAYAVAVAVLLTIWFAIWYHAVMTTPTRTGLEGIGLVFAFIPAIATAAGTMVRAVTLMVKARFVVFAISILGA